MNRPQMLLVGSLMLLACSDDEPSPRGTSSASSGGGAAGAASSAGGTGGTGGEAAGASGGGSPTGTIACGAGPCQLPLEVCCTEMGIGACVAGACPRGQGEG